MEKTFTEWYNTQKYYTEDFDTYERFYTILKEAWNAGYAAGKEEGYEEPGKQR